MKQLNKEQSFFTARTQFTSKNNTEIDSIIVLISILGTVEAKPRKLECKFYATCTNLLIVKFIQQFM